MTHCLSNAHWEPEARSDVRVETEGWDLPTLGERALARVQMERELLGERGDLLDEDLFRVKRVAIILGSSRGGTSLLHSFLRAHPGTLSLDGEHTPYYKLAGASFPRFASDRIPTDAEVDERTLSWLFMTSLGTPSDLVDIEDWVDRFLLRLPLQYDQNLNFSEIKRFLTRARSSEELKASLATLMWQYQVNQAYYDGGGFFDRRMETTRPCRSEGILEETPYVFPDLYKRTPKPEELEEKTLILKASVDAYRVPWLLNLFRASEVTIIHETRNPAASINGLMDGWRTFRGFYSHEVQDLGIAGYSELHPDHARLWCFDLPPDWPELTHSPLEVVCAHQWSGAHSHILRHSDMVDNVTIKFEDLVKGRRTRFEALEAVQRALGLDNGDARYRSLIDSMPVVMSTERPAPARWRKREAQVLAGVDTIDRDLVREIAGSVERWI